MRLMDEPRQEVESFGNMMAKISLCIIGSVSATIDLSTLLATAFIDCEVLFLQMKYIGLHDLVESNPKALYAY